MGEHGVQIASSTYYAHAARGFGATEAELADAYAANALFDLWTKNRKLYGRRKLAKTARRAGHDTGRDAVQRLVRCQPRSNTPCVSNKIRVSEEGLDQLPHAHHPQPDRLTCTFGHACACVAHERYRRRDT
ncbi:hypothetical protein [Phytoactinopolyspora limicola]|uniref:hypothetical protein n=1 Tax=Phytoactinopolyspora limicola TaxID=2715536 RepID=UPI001408DEF1|nr:hypothetical protein [Phytoactinopolyspora limicola]